MIEVAEWTEAGRLFHGKGAAQLEILYSVLIARHLSLQTAVGAKRTIRYQVTQQIM